MRKLFIIALLLALSTASAHAQVVQGGTAEPTGYQRGFSKNQWAASLGCMIAAYGTTVFSHNAIRCYLPLTDTWKTIFAEGNAGSAEGDQTPGVNPSGRDNEVSLYVDNTKQFWVWGGTHGNMSGVFDLSACAPTPSDGCATLVSAGPGDNIPVIEIGFTGVPAPAPGGGSDSGAAWNKDCDGGVGCGIIVGGNGGNADAFVWIIERNTAAQITGLGGTSHKYCPDGAGVLPWIVCRFTDTKPPARNQALGTTVAVGNDFYVGGGTDPDNTTQLADLWKLTRSTNTFSLVSSSFPAGYQTSVTYDSDLGVILANGNNATTQFLKGWDIANAEWVDFSALVSGIACQGNQASAYSPTAKRHIYTGGSYCDGSPNFGNSLPTGYILQVSPSGFNSGTRLYLTPGLWTSKPMPPARPGADAQNQTIGETGYGPESASTGVKHGRIRFGNGRLYYLHGDYGGPPFTGAYRSSMFSYDILGASSISEASKWRVEWPYCGLSGEISPANLDEVALAIDTTRNKVMYPGGFAGQPSIKATCNSYGITGNYYGHLEDNTETYLEFDMATNRYATRSGFTLHPYGGTRQGIFNPTTNHLIVPYADGGGAGLTFMDVSNSTWVQHGMVCAVPGPGQVADSTGSCAASKTMYVNDAQLIQEQLALDVANQVIWVVDTSKKSSGATPNEKFRLLKFDIATGVTTNYGFITLPVGSDVVQTPGVTQPHYCYANGPVSGASSLDCYNFPYYVAPFDAHMLMWDSVNGRLLWPAAESAGRFILHVFNPNDATWTVDMGLRDRPDRVLSGNAGTYIAEINAIVVFGGFGWPGYGGRNVDPGEFGYECPSCNAIPDQFWLLRLGNTSPLITPPPPTANAVNIGAGKTINVGAGKTWNIY